MLSQRRVPSAIPLVLLLLALATVFPFPKGHLYHEQTHDFISQNHMTVALNLSPAHGFLGFYRLTRDGDGSVAYEPYNRFPPLGYALIKLATLPFDDDVSTRLAAARTLMLAFFAAAAALAYLALCRLTGNRWAALAATLLAFSSYYALYYKDMIATEGVVDLFGLMLVLHGMAVFAAGGRFGQLLAKTCVALLLGWHVYALLLPFVLLGLAFALCHRDWQGARRHLTLGAVALAFGAMLLAANFTREYVALGGEVAPMQLPSVESMLHRTGLAERGADPSGGEDGGHDAPFDYGPWLAVVVRQFERVAWSAPYAVGYFVGNGTPDSGLAAGAPPKDAAIVVLGFGLAALIAVATLVLLLSPATRHRLPLAALALCGPSWALAMPNQSAIPFEGMFYLGVPLAVFALVLVRLDRLLGSRVRCAVIAGVAAVPTFALSNFLMAEAAAPNSAHVAPERALAADLDAIRDALGPGPEGNTVVISEAMDACREYRHHTRFGPRAVNWRYYLTGHIFVDYPNGRFADFVLGERSDLARTLTPHNKRAFLYDRASHDAALRRYERHAKDGVPALVSPAYAIYLVRGSEGSAGDELLFFRGRCPKPDVNNHAERIMMGGGSRVFVQVWPSDANDLRLARRQFGFRNLVNFEQHLPGWRQDGNCYAVCGLPDYGIAKIRAGLAASRPSSPAALSGPATYDIIWEGNFTPSRASPAAGHTADRGLDASSASSNQAAPSLR